MDRKTPHYPVLRAYVTEVTRDLISRGIIRKRQGQRVDDVIRDESRTIVAEIAGDLRAIAMELGLSFVTSGVAAVETIAKQRADAVVEAGKSALLELLAGAIQGKRK